MKFELAFLEVTRSLDEYKIVLVEKNVQRKLRAVTEVEALHEVSEDGWQIQFVERPERIGSPSVYYLQREAREWIEE